MLRLNHFIRICLLAVLFAITSACEKKKQEKDTEDSSVATPDPTLDSYYSYFSLKFFLAGAMNGTEMKTNLGPYLPSTDPYGVGASSPSIVSLSGIVD